MGAGAEEQGRCARRAREERLRRDERTTGMSAEANDGSAGDTHARGSKRPMDGNKRGGANKRERAGLQGLYHRTGTWQKRPLVVPFGSPFIPRPLLPFSPVPPPARASPSARVVSSSSPNPRSPSSPASSSSIRTARTARSQSHRTSRPRCDTLSLAGEHKPSSLLHARSSPGPSRRFTCCVAERHSEIPPCASPFLVTLRHDHAPPASMPIRGAHWPSIISIPWPSTGSPTLHLNTERLQSSVLVSHGD